MGGEKKNWYIKMNSIHLELGKQFSWQYILSQTVPLHFLLAHLIKPRLTSAYNKHLLDTTQVCEPKETISSTFLKCGE